LLRAYEESAARVEQNQGMSIRRALVLGSGGATGVAWELGVLTGLSRAGLRLDADLVVGTSAGALVAAWLTTSGAVPELDETRRERAGRIGPTHVARLVAAQLHPSRRHALAWLGARAMSTWTPGAEAGWVDRVGEGLSGLAWPASLVIVATDATSGRPAFFSAGQPADLAAAVAASCALPGVFPAVRIDGRLHFDGGLRSPANLDVAAEADVLIAVAPLSAAVRANRRPVRQAAHLARSGVRVVLIEPDLAGRVALGPDLLAPGRSERAFAAGLEAGVRHAAEALAAWTGEPRLATPRSAHKL
jgi:NTE family protein